MINEMPRILGYTDIPAHLKDYSGMPAKIVEHIQQDKALVVELEDCERVFKYQRCLINAAIKRYGKGKMQTAIEGNRIYLWLREEEPEIPGELKMLQLNPDGQPC